ncbi:MAG: hypothetical protein IJF71_04740, partial [Clostridia bacterium]|nr:hypothetical protein [Clostridia bacterium]
MQKNLKKIAVSIMLVCLTLAMLACNIPSDNRAVISVDESLIPTGGLVGKEIILPAATATDVDGTDISESILLTVAGLRDGTEASWPIYRQPGNIERAFVPARYSSWKVTYSVIGSDGNTVTKDFYINLEMDTTKPVLTVASQEAITVGAGEQLVLPAATATDDGSDLSESIKVKVYQGNALLETYKTGGAEYAITLPSGTYTAVYACEDASGNAAEEISVALTVERLPYNTELMTEGAFKRGYASRFVNGELTVGFVSNETYDGTDCSSAAFKADKIGLNDIVGVSAVFDPVPAEGGENFYTMSYYASKSNDQLAPNGNESQWPQAFFIRVHDKTVTIFSYNGEAEAVADIALRDGAVHNIYMQTVALGAGADAEDAAISFRVWIDALPTEAPTLSVTVDASHPYFDAKTLAEMWNGTPGWLSFGSYINNKNVYNDDVMTVKSIKLFKEDAQDFFALLPVISLDGSFASIYEKDEAITLPVATFENTVESAIGVYDSEGNLVEAIDATTTTYAFTAAGEYTVRYTAKNADGIRLERKFNISVINDYSEFTLAWPTTIGVADGAYEDAFLISNAQSGNDQIGVQILNDSGDNNLVAAKITVQGFANGCWFGLQISGASNYTNWISGSGLCLNFGGGRLYYGIGGKETPNAVAVTDALFGEQSEYVRNSNGVNIFELCLVYRLNYVGSEAEGLKAIELEVWYGNSFEAMTKAVFHAIEGKVSFAKSEEVVENATKPTLTAKFIYDLGVSESTYGQGAGVYFVFAQGGQDWRTSKAGCDSVAVLENEPKIAPDFTVVKPASSVYFTNQAITLPEIVSGDNVASMRVYYEADGAEVEVEGNTVSFANAGSYTVFFEAVSDEGVTLCKKWSLTVMQKSETVDMPTNFTAEPTATVSESFQQTSGQAGAADATQITNGLGSGKYTYVTITQNDYSAGNLCVYGLQITGNTKVGAWFNNGKGLYVVLKDNNIYLSLNGRENENNLCVVENAISSSSKYVSGSTLQISLAIKANYLTQDGGLKVMQLEMWAKAATGVYEKLAWKGLTGLLTQDQVNELLSAEDPTVISFNAGILDNLAKQGYTEITEQGAGVVVAHAQGPAATITVSGVSVSTTEPQTEVIALEIPTVGEVSVSNTSGSKKAAQYGDDNNVQILSNSGNGQLVAMKLSMNPFNTNNPGFFGVQILGS